MNKERLNELKRKINGIAGKSDLAYQDECDLDDLIDAELSRQSVTDEDVQRAIDEFDGHEWQYEIRDEFNNFHGQHYYLDDKTEKLILSALRAYRKPSLSIQQIINALQTILDEKLTMGPNDIKELIWHLQNCTTERKPTAEEVESIDRAIAEIIGTDYGECQMHRDTLETAITALRRMKGSESNA